jgi:hypothetical protein
VKRRGATLIAGSTLGLAARKTHRLLTSGALTLDLDLGRRLQPLGPLVQPIRAQMDVVFDVIAAPYLGKTPRALADKLLVWERGADMVLAAHYTQVKCGITTALETKRCGAAAGGCGASRPDEPGPGLAAYRVASS